MEHPLLDNLDGIQSTYKTLGHKVCDLSDITEVKMDKVLIETIKGSTTMVGLSRFNETVLAMNLESSTRLCSGSINNSNDMKMKVKTSNITPGESNAHYWMKLHQNNATFNIDVNRSSMHIPMTYPKRKFSTMSRFRGVSESKQQENTSSLTSRSSFTQTSSSTLSTMDEWNEYSGHTVNSGGTLENRTNEWSIDDIKNSIEIFDSIDYNTKEVDHDATLITNDTSLGNNANTASVSNPLNSQDKQKFNTNENNNEKEENDAAKEIVRNVFTEEIEELNESETIIKKMRVEEQPTIEEFNMHHGVPYGSIEFHGADSPLLNLLSEIANDSPNIIHDLNTENVSRLRNETPVSESKHGSISTLTGGDSGSGNNSTVGSGSEEDILEIEPPIMAPTARHAR